MGSKAKITKYIVPIIQRKIDESGARYYVEPFAGGCNVIDKIKAEYHIASDSNKYLIALFQHLQDGGELPEHITREEMKQLDECLTVSVGINTKAEKEPAEMESLRQQLAEMADRQQVAEKQAKTYKEMYEFLLSKQLGTKGK